MDFSDPPRISAVLGPTNTGKTHLALERMLGHATGMIGFPLRLLARENYDRIVRLKGPGSVALITGEERIIPPRPRWFVCTVEAMPLNRMVDFLAVDEIQLAADADRGHVFTHRLLHARGRSETMFLGSDTIEPLISRLIPGVEIISRPRLSRLTYSGPKKLTRLPRRSAVVAFSAQDVYSIAELIRRTRGGAAVVLGALSPRTRNAQVALFQSGEVDHLVATDAIGMGLNMQIDHVAFASMRKFDGRAPRDLTAPEVAQIGGRAGRHLNDGTFGTTGDAPGIDPDIIAQVENHTFTPLRGIFWRNADLKFTSYEALITSLIKPPTTPGLLRTQPADDQRVLEALVRDPDIMQAARGLGQLRLLWEVSQIPDFRKVRPETHARLVAQIFGHLTKGNHRLPTDWLNKHLSALDRSDGDMHALMDRIASIRVWTYVSHRNNWVSDGDHWRERARAIEDTLSDALHQRLTQRFVDVRTSVLAKRLRDGDALLASVSDGDAVTVEGHHLGHLEGLTFVPDQADGRSASRAVQNAAEKALRGEITRRVDQLCADKAAAFRLSHDGDILWRGSFVGRLVRGSAPLRPHVDVPFDGLLTSDQRDRVRSHLSTWLETWAKEALCPLLDPPNDSHSAPVRGLLFQLAEGLGTLGTGLASQQVNSLTSDDHKTLAKLGVRLGRRSIYVPRLFKPAAQRLRGLFWCLWTGTPVPASLPHGQMSLPITEPVPEALAFALGYRRVPGPDRADRLLRVDGIEQASAALRTLFRQQKSPKSSEGTDPQPPLTSKGLNAVLSPLKTPLPYQENVLALLGWKAARQDTPEGGSIIQLIPLKPPPKGKPPTKRQETDNKKKAKSAAQDDPAAQAHRTETKARAAKTAQRGAPRGPRPFLRPEDSPFAILQGVIKAAEPSPAPAPKAKGKKAKKATAPTQPNTTAPEAHPAGADQTDGATEALPTGTRKRRPRRKASGDATQAPGGQTPSQTDPDQPPKAKKRRRRKPKSAAAPTQAQAQAQTQAQAQAQTPAESLTEDATSPNASPTPPETPPAKRKKRRPRRKPRTGTTGATTDHTPPTTKTPD